MILNKLTIENFGEVKYSEISFDSRLTMITGSNTDDVVKAIGVVTKNKFLTGDITRDMVSPNTFISAEIETASGRFLIRARGRPSEYGYEYEVFTGNSLVKSSSEELFRSIRLCEEEESLTYYRFSQKNVYSERFLHYKDPDNYYSPGEFQRRTDRAGATQSFRTCLAKYIQEYKVEKVLIKDGQSGTQLFEYLSFLKVNVFWEMFESIRDLHHERWPLIVDIVAPDSEIEIERMLEKSYALKRQLIIKS